MTNILPIDYQTDALICFPRENMKKKKLKVRSIKYSTKAIIPNYTRIRRTHPTMLLVDISVEGLQIPVIFPIFNFTPKSIPLAVSCSIHAG